MAPSPLYGPARATFRARGFARMQPYQIYTKPLGSQVRAWVGLTGTTTPDTLTLGPLIGLRHDLVQHWVSVCLGADPVRSTEPTVSIGLLSLLSRSRTSPAWLLVQGEDERNAETWELLGRDIDEYAMPWILDRSTNDALVESLRRIEGADTSRLKLPVLLWIMGRPDDARQAVEDGHSFEFRGGMVVDYDAYATRLLAKIDAWPDGPHSAS
jgi:hypothetical protein